MYIKTKTWQNFTSIRLAAIQKNQETTSIGRQSCREIVTLYWLVGMQNDAATVEKCGGFSKTKTKKQNKKELPDDPAIPFLGK